MRHTTKVLWLLFASALLSACERLGGNEAINAVICGTYTFTYETSEPLDMDFDYEYVVFRPDGTCALTYEDGELSGTYRAGDAAIVIEGEGTPDGKPMLWRVVSFSPYDILADYTFDNNGLPVTAVIKLEKLRE